MTGSVLLKCFEVLFVPRQSAAKDGMLEHSVPTEDSCSLIAEPQTPQQTLPLQTILDLCLPRTAVNDWWSTDLSKTVLGVNRRHSAEYLLGRL